ncbi:hypothetical protein [Bradyrhizobium sp. 157]|uniref:hypothetical protein n=1 Tax=Bradyrhizobium sp. 157 TaxID=2782631 RepID=UPI001FF8ECF7|nr:hypothetical protein [Bradyrhizobium sp. 157]
MFLHSPKTYGWRAAPLWPKELREITNGRALWTILLLLCPLVGYSFFQAVSLCGEASTAALQSPVLANSLSPLDGILVPTLGSFYVAVTLLFPFVSVQWGLLLSAAFAAGMTLTIALFHWRRCSRRHGFCPSLCARRRSVSVPHRHWKPSRLSR